MATASEDLAVLRTAESISDSVWKLVVTWEVFAREGLGRPLVAAADQVGANLAQAFNCRQDEEKLPFLYAARGRLFETKYWFNRAQARGLLQPAHIESYVFALSQLARQLNGLVEAVKKQGSGEAAAAHALREDAADYEVGEIGAALFSEADFEFLDTPFNPELYKGFRGHEHLWGREDDTETRAARAAEAAAPDELKESE